MGVMNNTRFVKIHPNLGCMLSATEVAFLVLLLDQKFIRIWDIARHGAVLIFKSQ